MLKGLMNSVNAPVVGLDEESVVMLPVSQIHPSPAQARKVFDAGKLAELAETIKAHGVLQPVIVTPTKTGYNLIAGERRLRASKIAGRVEIPAIVRDSDPKGLAVLGMIENTQRADLNAIEEAAGYQMLIDDHKMTQAEIAIQVGKSRSTIANLLRLLDLPQVMQEAIVDGTCNVGHGLELLRIKDHKTEMELLAKDCVANRWGKGELADNVDFRLKKVNGKAVINGSAIYTGEPVKPEPLTVKECEAVIYKKLNRNATGNLASKIEWLAKNADIEGYREITIKQITDSVFAEAYSGIVRELDAQVAQRKAAVSSRYVAPEPDKMPDPEMLPDWAKDEVLDIPMAKALSQAPDNSVVVGAVEVEDAEEDRYAVLVRALRKIAYFAAGQENGAEIRALHADLITIAEAALVEVGA